MNDDVRTNEIPLKWDTRDGKTALVRAIFQHFKDNEAARNDCLDYEKGYAIVREVAGKLGIEVPPDARILFLPEGDWQKGEPPEQKMTLASGLVHNAGSSLIIDLPPKDLTIKESLRYACTYVPW